ncbi:MAG: AAA family ATPase [Bacteroidia bacterium]|nr:AAA family ATPase [Bacteroidia bacterium]
MEKLKTSVREQMQGLINGLCQGLYEREEPMKLALLSAVAGESIFLLGPPGVGKSLIARRLKFAFREGRSFEYLMSRFSTPDEIFGPVSIRKLKDEDKYERLTERYLPGANIVFLDEIWKSGPAIQNALLTILNEKIYRNGESDIKVDIKAIITASNELPPNSESFQPLWDRFLIRFEMGGVKGHRAFLNMITDTSDVYADDIPEAVKMGQAELESWSKKIDQIELPPEVLNTIQVVRAKLEEGNALQNIQHDPIHIYDRRWKKIVRMIRSSAFLNGRLKADLMDCFLMVHCLWAHPNQIPFIQEVVSETIRKHGYSIAVNLGMLRRELDEFDKDVEDETRIKRVIAEDRLQPQQEEFFSFVQMEKQFQGELIRISEFQKLSVSEPSIINIYDEKQTLRHRLQARKSEKEHHLEISFNGTEFTLPLRTHKVERSEIIYKKPHKLISQHWDARGEKLLTYILEQRKRLIEEEPEEIGTIQQHLFVDAALGSIVKANLKEVAEVLDKLELRLEKILYAYQSL